MGQTLVVPDPLTDLARLEGVPSGLDAARAAVHAAHAVLTDHGLRTMPADQVAAAWLASAQLTDDHRQWMAGAIRLSSELPALAAVLRVAPRQALARAHALAADGMVADEELGRLRDSCEVASRMAGLTELLTADSDAPALVLAAVAHAEIATVAPFGTADGLVARAVERMVLISSGFDPCGVVFTEFGHLRRREDYGRLLDGYRDGSSGGVRDWILYVAQVAVDSAGGSPVSVVR